MNFSRYVIKQDICRICGACEQVCTEQAIVVGADKKIHIDDTRCNRCGYCVEACKLRAIVKRVGIYR
jgi:MinD superfamily P-loop ATPase